MNAAKPPPELMPLEKRLIWILLIVLILPCAPTVFLVPRFLFGLLWDYTAAVVAGIAFPVVFILAKRKGKSILASIFAAAKWSVISLAALVLLLFTLTLFFGPGYKPFTLGYWIHAKLLLSPSEVRNWAAQQPATTNMTETIPYAQWPSSLKRISSGHGMLEFYPETKTVMLVEGSGFGHWGIIVVQKLETNELNHLYTIKLDDRAWVWHDIQ